MSMSSKQKVSLAIYVLSMLLFALLLTFSNKIVYAAVKDGSDLTPVADMTSFPKTAKGFSRVEAMEYCGGRMDKFRVYGWAYASDETRATDDEKNEKRVYVLLRGQNDKWYAAEGVAAIRPDIFYAHEYDRYFPRSSSVGFEALFSTLALPYGTFQIYTYAYEKEGVSALMDTGKRIEKSMTGGVEDISNQPVSLEKTPISGGKGRWELDQVEYEEDGQLLVKGWGVFTDLYYDEAAHFLRLTDANGASYVYRAGTIDRPDIEKAYRNNQFLQSGFRQQILLPNGFDDSKVSMEYSLRSNGIYYRSTEPKTYRHGADGWVPDKTS